MADELKEGIDHLPRYLNVGEGTALDKSFLQPLGEVDYSKTKAEINVGDINLTLAFEPVDWSKLKMNDLLTYMRVREDSKHTYTLEELTLSDQNDRHTVRLREMLSNDTAVIFNPTGDVNESGISEGTVFLFGDPSSPAGIIGLLHEVGHLKTDHLKDQTLESGRRSLDRTYGKLSHDQAAAIIKNERGAWAFTLKKLRPFFTKDGIFTKEKFNALMQRQLSGYTSEIREKVTLDVEAEENS